MKEKFAVFILCSYLLVGSVIHIYDNVTGGFLPYTEVPQWLNSYWTSLGILNLLSIYLLIKHRRTGVLMLILTMGSDVVFTSYAHYNFGLFSDEVPLQLQSMIFGFALAASLWLWSANRVRNSRQIFR
ncbi:MULTISPECIES: hypothetical protein [Vibrio]|jgi:hypothetical protein|uniref:Uncharacterized protein n=1 Tax=Vibrio rotiferianus TaxID=190895 RepID=A0A2K7SW10_9VIBR|nr:MULTISPECIES: hypothetical protein [Vibrio]ASI96371.1 hypothetical protein BSZ04_15530 [Vibrio rotiferianus]MDK9778039.1 hypothetical protein [Vibrio sp. D401a]MDK9801454.1 hypothetical protein [Vibrio sp. D406a]NOH49099.1 hypothetical protein [Vibrio rotiferianus]OHY93817.1 hypothetical protein BI375_18390 [Vibrio rotiferianus]